MVQTGTSRRTFVKATGGTALLTGIAGCAGGDDDDSISIGAVFPLSGDLAQLGEESFRGAELAIMERNENGGIDGQEIELERADAPEPDDAVSGVENLVTREEVELILGTYGSSHSAAATDRAAQDDVPYWELGAVADSITDDNPGNVFRTCATAQFFGADGVDLAVNEIAPALDTEPEDLRMAVMHESGEYGEAVGEAAQQAAEEANVEIVEEISYEADTSDLSSEIQSLDDADVQVLNHTGYDPDVDLLWNQLENLGVYIPAVIGNGASYSFRTFLDNVGEEAVTGVFNMDFTQYNTNADFAPGIQEFVDLYEDEYGEEPLSGHSLVNYFGAHVAFDAVENAESTDLEDIREAAFDLDVEENTTATSWGVNFDEETQQNERINVVGHQWQESDDTLDLYSVFPEDARLDGVDVDYMPKPDYTE